MRIDNWPLDRIMRLPDWCFGRRWWVGCYVGDTGGRYADYFVEEGLPDKFVVWGVLFAARSPNCLEALRSTIRLIQMGGFDPNGMAAAERLLKGISTPGILYEFYVNSNGVTWINAEREIIESNGRRIAVAGNGDQTIAYEMTIGVLISALPKEVPDWLISVQDKRPL